MEQKKIAIIHSRDSSLVTLLARLTQELGHDPSTMVVNKDTPPQDVASFVQGISPLSLVLLAENYISYNDPFVQAYLRQNEYKVTSEGIEGIKGGEGIEALVEIKKSHPNLPVFIVSGIQLIFLLFSIKLSLISVTFTNTLEINLYINGVSVLGQCGY